MSSVLVLAATATVGFLVYTGARESLIESASEQVAQTTETVKVGTWGTIAAIADDIRFLAQTPPVEGIVRARLERGLDPRWAIRDDEWGVQLAETFRAFLESRTSYLKVRFVGIREGGREMVRAERRQGRVVFPDASELRDLSHVQYIQVADSLAAGDIYLSRVRWGDVEDGIPDSVPVLDVSTPVFSELGELFGAVAVTVDFREVTAAMENLVNPNQTLYVADEDGRLLFLYKQSGLTNAPAPAARRERIQNLFPDVDRLVTGASNSTHLLDANLTDGTRGIAYFETVHMRPDADAPRLLLGTSEPHETILSDVRSVRNTSAVITVLLCLAAVAVAMTTSRHITRPIQQISKAVAAFGKRGDPELLPTERDDEIGLLARSFESMQLQIQDQIRSLEDLSRTLEQRVRDRTAELERLNRELQASNRELREITAVASHDLQEPLRKLRSFSDLLATEHGDALGEDGIYYAERIFGLAERMSNLLNDLAAFSGVVEETRHVEKVDLGRIAAEVVDRLRPSIEDAGADIRMGQLPEIAADPRHVRALLHNLIENAISFRQPDRDLVIHVHAEMGRDASDSPVWRLAVEDNGVGFEEKYADRIFSPFERLQGDRTRDRTGMGLTICRRIAENHGGTIEAHGRPGEGATFVVTFPVDGCTGRSGA